MCEKITSLSDYLKWAKACHEVEYGPNNELFCYQDHVYFRGHASIAWELIPSLFRDKEGRNYSEYKMLQQANNLLWAELADCKTELEKMIRLQHYGLKTRLLDVTYNPLIALYFACQESIEKEKDGIVFCGYKYESSMKEPMAIADYVFNHDAITIDESELDIVCARYKVNKHSLENIHLFNPPFNNQRVLAQNGAFIISPLLKTNEEPPFNSAKHKEVKNKMETAFAKNIVVAEYSKNYILEELDSLGFNRYTIFRDIANTLKYINEKEEKYGTKIPDF